MKDKAELPPSSRTTVPQRSYPLIRNCRSRNEDAIPSHQSSHLPSPHAAMKKPWSVPMSADKERCDGWRKSLCISLTLETGNISSLLLSISARQRCARRSGCQRDWDHHRCIKIRPGRWFSSVIGPFERRDPEVRLCKSSPKLRILLSCSLAWPRNASASHDWVVSRDWQPLNPLTGLGWSRPASHHRRLS